MTRTLLLTFVGAFAIGGGFWFFKPRPAIEDRLPAVVEDQSETVTDDRLNVLLITLDTTRADHLGCYGYELAQTPAIDVLANRGVVFEHAYAPAPLTLPSHASMLTALYPFEHGLLRNGHNVLSNEIPTLAEKLRERGYSTGAFIASVALNHEYGLDRGFQVYNDHVNGPPTVEPRGEQKRSADQVVDAALHWLTAKGSKPFFCWMHLFDPHATYLAHQETFGDKFISNPYDAEIAYVDVQLGRLVDFLEKRSLLEKTVIVIVGDHGEGLMEHRERYHGYMLYNSTLQVPLIIWNPSKNSQPGRCKDPVSLIDVTPTILDCLDIPGLESTSGRSLKPALSGEPLALRACYGVANSAFIEEGLSPMSCLIAQDWKYIASAQPELYNLREDPGELKNLVESNPRVAQELQEQLLALEESGVRFQEEKLTLSDRERGKLSGLGYVGGSATSVPRGNRLPDIKERLDEFEAFENTLAELINAGPEAAIPSLYLLINENPRFLAPRQLLALLLSNQGKTIDAQTQYLAILDIDPKHLGAHSWLANRFIKSKQDEKALVHLLKAIDGFPTSVNLHLDAAKVLRALGRKREAAVHTDLAKKLSQDQRERRKAN